MYSATPTPDASSICDTFIPLDYTYSTYILTFTMTYFVMPMVFISKQNNINAINYGVLALFISYIVLDLFIKNSLQCIPNIFSSVVIGNLLGGLFCGLIAVMVMYGSTLKNFLYINEVNTNKEVCSMPSKQQFKCRVFKDGTLIGDI
jgi:RsiW-degrading membrane proteinase PrsW (M82 family)